MKVMVPSFKLKIVSRLKYLHEGGQVFQQVEVYGRLEKVVSARKYYFRIVDRLDSKKERWTLRLASIKRQERKVSINI